MNRLSRWLLAAMAFSIASAGTAVAEDNNFYIGIAAGGSRTDIDADDVNTYLSGKFGLGASSSVNSTDTDFKVFAGYRLARYLAFEAGYTDLGRFGFSSKIISGGTGTFGGNFKAHSIDLTAVGLLPMGETFSPFVRAGVGAWDVDVSRHATGTSSVASGSASKSGISPLAGLGVLARYSPQLSFRAEIERHFSIGGDETMGKRVVDLWALGIQYAF